MFLEGHGRLSIVQPADAGDLDASGVEYPLASHNRLASGTSVLSISEVKKCCLARRDFSRPRICASPSGRMARRRIHADRIIDADKNSCRIRENGSLSSPRSINAPAAWSHVCVVCNPNTNSTICVTGPRGFRGRLCVAECGIEGLPFQIGFQISGLWIATDVSRPSHMTALTKRTFVPGSGRRNSDSSDAEAKPYGSFIPASSNSASREW